MQNRPNSVGPFMRPREREPNEMEIIFVTRPPLLSSLWHTLFVLSCADGNSGEALDLHIFIIFGVTCEPKM